MQEERALLNPIRVSTYVCMEEMLAWTKTQMNWYFRLDVSEVAGKTR